MRSNATRSVLLLQSLWLLLVDARFRDDLDLVSLNWVTGSSEVKCHAPIRSVVMGLLFVGFGISSISQILTGLFRIFMRDLDLVSRNWVTGSSKVKCHVPIRSAAKGLLFVSFGISSITQLVTDLFDIFKADLDHVSWNWVKGSSKVKSNMSI
jgi:hypothetical protein